MCSPPHPAEKRLPIRPVAAEVAEGGQHPHSCLDPVHQVPTMPRSPPWGLRVISQAPPQQMWRHFFSVILVRTQKCRSEAGQRSPCPPPHLPTSCHLHRMQLRPPVLPQGTSSIPLKCLPPQSPHPSPALLQCHVADTYGPEDTRMVVALPQPSGSWAPWI